MGEEGGVEGKEHLRRQRKSHRESKLSLKELAKRRREKKIRKCFQQREVEFEGGKDSGS